MHAILGGDHVQARSRNGHRGAEKRHWHSYRALDSGRGRGHFGGMDWTPLRWLRKALSYVVTVIGLPFAIALSFGSSAGRQNEGRCHTAFIEHAKQILRHDTVRGRIVGRRDGVV